MTIQRNKTIALSVGIGVALCAIVTWVDVAHAVTCGATGAALKIVFTNPTGATITNTVVVSGNIITGFKTCTDQGNTYTHTLSGTELNSGSHTIYIPLYSDAPAPTPTPSTGWVNAGMWVHQITVTDGSGNSYTQYQKGVAVEAPNSGTNPFSTVNWSYYPNWVTVSTTGDAGGTGCTGMSCTLRQALYTAQHTTRSSTSPFLIRFSTSSTLTMTQAAALGMYGNTTIDGTSSSGNPWFVGEAIGTQDAFFNIDLANTTQFTVAGDGNTIKGVAIINSLPATPTPHGTTPTPTAVPPQFGALIVDDGVLGPATNTKIEAVRLDGGAGNIPSCPGGVCTGRDLINLTGNGVTILNVEGRAAYGSGANLAQNSSGMSITDSWFHHNLDHNLYVNASNIVRNVLEFAGYRTSDNKGIGTADGLMTAAQANITSSANLIRSNSGAGVQLNAVTNQTPIPSMSNDYSCGNQDVGILVSSGGGGDITASGIVTAYNKSYGLEFDSSVTSGSMTFGPDSAFTANGDPGAAKVGFKNLGSVTVSATNNQWRGLSVVAPTPTPLCNTSSDISGSISCDPIQDYGAASVALDSSHAAIPSNAIRNTQTVRVTGSGFDAINGNPLPGATPCLSHPTPGLTPSTDDCCRKTSKANPCDNSSPPLGTSGTGNCVAFEDSSGTWTKLGVTAVTPRLIITSLPTGSGFSCIGGKGEQVRVAKKKNSGLDSADMKSYCTNTDQK